MIWLLMLITILGYSLANVDYFSLHENIWLLNKNNHYNTLFSAFTDITSSNYIKYDESNLERLTSKDIQLNISIKIWRITFSGIPNYDQYIASKTIQSLNTRSNAYIEFQNGLTTLKANDFIRWGDNIGYAILEDQANPQDQQQQLQVKNHCNYGYWPPNTTCPIAYSGEYSFPLNPSIELNIDGCYVAYDKNPLGYALNGIPLLGLIDPDKSYNNENSWHIVNNEYEKNNFDICSGSSNYHGIYNHYSYSNCLAFRLNDNRIISSSSSSSHSPVYGISSDGYPIYGPWQAKNNLARSCWKIRNYQYKTGTGGGCIDHIRSCVLIDPGDPSKGTKDAIFKGPGFQDIVSIKDSLYKIITNNGIFLEDYYYDQDCYINHEDSFHDNKLDKHNGHIHDIDIDNIGYHYHFTVDESMNAIFPFIIGPKYYGCIQGSICRSNMIENINNNNNSITKLSQCFRYNPQKSSAKHLITNNVFKLFPNNNIHINLAYNNYTTSTNDNDNDNDVVMTNVIIGSVFGSILLISIFSLLILIAICICCPKKTIAYKMTRKVIPI